MSCCRLPALVELVSSVLACEVTFRNSRPASRRERGSLFDTGRPLGMNPSLAPRAARVGKARRQRTRGAGDRVLWHPGVEVFNHISHSCEAAAMEEEPAAPELPHRRGAE